MNNIGEILPSVGICDHDIRAPAIIYNTLHFSVLTLSSDFIWIPLSGEMARNARSQGFVLVGDEELVEERKKHRTKEARRKGRGGGGGTTLKSWRNFMGQA